MYWNRTTAAAAREEMPLSSISRTTSTPITTVENMNPGMSTQITSTCCTPPPSYHNINLPLGHPSTLTNERGAPPSYEEAIDPNGMLSYIFVVYAYICKLNMYLSFYIISSTTAILRFFIWSYERST